MSNCCRRLFTAAPLTLLIATSADARSSLADGQAVVSLQNDQPCFSYPLDQVTAKYKFIPSLVEVFLNDKQDAAASGAKLWEFRRTRAQLLSNEPPPADRCVEYGTPPPGGSPASATPLEVNTPYRDYMTVFSAEPGSGGNRIYYEDFCITLDAHSGKSIAKAVHNRATNRFGCP